MFKKFYIGKCHNILVPMFVSIQSKYCCLPRRVPFQRQTQSDRPQITPDIMSIKSDTIFYHWASIWDRESIWTTWIILALRFMFYILLYLNNIYFFYDLIWCGIDNIVCDQVFENGYFLNLLNEILEKFIFHTILVITKTDKLFFQETQHPMSCGQYY